MNRLIKHLGWIAAVGLSLIAVNTFAQNLRVGHPDEYVVKTGDTLWDISARFLEDPWLWPEIWHINEQVSNPHLIYPGDLLRLIYVDGEPRLVMDRGVVKLSPEMRETRHDDAISSIPLDSIRQFLTQNRVVGEDELEAAPYMVAGPEGRIMVAAGDSLYARGTMQPGVRVYQVFREGDEYRDPKTGEVLGVRAEYKGAARYRNTAKDISRMTVIDSYQEVSLGDRFLPLEQDQLDSMLFPVVPETLVSGEIIAVEGGVSQIGLLDVVAINRGRDTQLEVGHLLAIMEAGEKVRDRVAGGTVMLPDEQAGMLMIFKVYEKMSFGLVLEAEKSLSVGHLVTNLFSQAAYEENKAKLDSENEGGLLKGITDIFDRGSRPE